jgi:hypothetical protein
MSIQLQIEEMPAYLAARFIGTGAAEEIWRQFELIAERSKRANKKKLLLDLRETHVDLLFTHRYCLATEAMIFMFYNVIKVAAVGRPEQLDYKKFGEMVALNRWLNARVFTIVEDAEEWLLE